MINRLLRDDASKGRTGTKTRTSVRDIWNTLKDPGEFLKSMTTSILTILQRLDRLLVLCNDYLRPQKPSISISRTQSETTGLLKVRE
jgi:hypothetical protein